MRMHALNSHVSIRSSISALQQSDFAKSADHQGLGAIPSTKETRLSKKRKKNKAEEAPRTWTSATGVATDPQTATSPSPWV